MIFYIKRLICFKLFLIFLLFIIGLKAPGLESLPPQKFSPLNLEIFCWTFLKFPLLKYFSKFLRLSKSKSNNSLFFLDTNTWFNEISLVLPLENVFFFLFLDFLTIRALFLSCDSSRLFSCVLKEIFFLRIRSFLGLSSRVVFSIDRRKTILLESDWRSEIEECLQKLLFLNSSIFLEKVTGSSIFLRDSLENQHFSS